MKQQVSIKNHLLGVGRMLLKIIRYALGTIFVLLAVAAVIVIFTTDEIVFPALLGTVFIIIAIVLFRPHKHEQLSPAVVKTVDGKQLSLKESSTPEIETFSSTDNRAISQQQYAAMRRKEEEDLEKRYNLNTIRGINAIPKNASIHKGGGIQSYTGDIDYYLRHKSSEYENAGKIDLAIACARKSNEIRFYCRNGYRRGDYYLLVRILARARRIDEAKSEKAKIDTFFDALDYDNDSLLCTRESVIQNVLKSAKALETDLVIMNVHGLACSECAKYQGRVFSLSGKSKIFPKIPDEFWEYGAIHPRCGHGFCPFIYGISDPELDKTLSIHKIADKRYAKNIVAFSNRPFVDDRPPEDIKAAIDRYHEMELERQKQLNEWEHVIEFEVQRGIDRRNYQWLQTNLPDMCPKSLSGYRRMRNQNTKNFVKLKAVAKEKGVEL